MDYKLVEAASYKSIDGLKLVTAYQDLFSRLLVFQYNSAMQLTSETKLGQLQDIYLTEAEYWARLLQLLIRKLPENSAMQASLTKIAPSVAGQSCVSFFQFPRQSSGRVPLTYDEAVNVVAEYQGLPSDSTLLLN